MNVLTHPCDIWLKRTGGMLKQWIPSIYGFGIMELRSIKEVECLSYGAFRTNSVIIGMRFVVVVVVVVRRGTE